MKNIKGDTYSCPTHCSGLIVTGYSHSESNLDMENLISEEVVAYNRYKKWFRFPSKLKGLLDLGEGNSLISSWYSRF